MNLKRAYLALAAAGAILLAGLSLARWSAPTVPPAPLPADSPVPAATSAASNSASATLSNDLEIIIPPRAATRRIPTQPAQHAEEPGGRLEDRLQEDPIIIRIKQTATTAAISEASSSATVLQEQRESAVGAGATHARLGAIVGTVPGGLALTYQLARVDVPPWMLGTPLEVGLEVEGNLAQVGGGLSVGGKAFAAAGGFLGWQGPGWYVGLGLRF